MKELNYHFNETEYSKDKMKFRQQFEKDCKTLCEDLIQYCLFEHGLSLKEIGDWGETDVYFKFPNINGEGFDLRIPFKLVFSYDEKRGTLKSRVVVDYNLAYNMYWKCVDGIRGNSKRSS